jgi:hypothetical protein
VRRPIAFNGVQIAVANAAGFYLDEHVTAGPGAGRATVSIASPAPILRSSAAFMDMLKIVPHWVCGAKLVGVAIIHALCIMGSALPSSNSPGFMQ